MTKHKEVEIKEGFKGNEGGFLLPEEAVNDAEFMDVLKGTVEERLETEEKPKEAEKKVDPFGYEVYQTVCQQFVAALRHLKLVNGWHGYFRTLVSLPFAEYSALETYLAVNPEMADDLRGWEISIDHSYIEDGSPWVEVVPAE